MLFVFFCNVCSVAVKLPRLGFLPFVGSGGGGVNCLIYLLSAVVVVEMVVYNFANLFSFHIQAALFACLIVCLSDCLFVWVLRLKSLQSVVVIFVVAAVVLLYRDPDHLSLPWTLCFLFFALFLVVQFHQWSPSWQERRRSSAGAAQHILCLLSRLQ